MLSVRPSFSYKAAVEGETTLITDKGMGTICRRAMRRKRKIGNRRKNNLEFRIENLELGTGDRGKHIWRRRRENTIISIAE
ncbi:MAG: hypothetical protein NT178_02370 [Proteobacteria bacterium]|nr:hypothetical protein [Pseudomonadota bacterium]